MSWSVAGSLGIDPWRVAALAGLGLLLSACAAWDEAAIPGSAAALAKDQIMLVRQQPPSFGYFRLETQCARYPDLAVFVAKRGIPDFLAETRDSSRHYLILYYLEPRQSYACRTHAGQPKQVEFAGPYGVTAGEFKLLDSFRKGKLH